MNNLDQFSIKGCDISSVQGAVDFNWLYDQGFRFVIAKCYQGNDGKDPYFLYNMQKAKSYGLCVAAYHFVYPLPDNPAHPNRNPVDQANLHFNNANGELALIDVEFPAPQDFDKWGCSPTQVNDWLEQYLDRYEQLSGQHCPVYTYPWFAKFCNFSNKVACHPLWLAEYDGQVNAPHPWTNDDVMMVQTAGGDQLTLPNGIKCDTDVVRDLSFWIT